MNCERYEHQIALLVTGDLPRRKARTVQRHVGQCATCQVTAEALRANRDSLCALAETGTDGELRDALRQRVLGEIERSNSISRSRRHRVRYAMVYAGLAVLVTCAVAVGWRWYGAESQPYLGVRTAADSTRVDRVPSLREPDSSEFEISDPQIVDSSAREPKGSIVVRLYTSDPRVVFFLVSDSTGG